jgi:hypothetical protein
MKTMIVYFKNSKPLCIAVDRWEKTEDCFCFFRKNEVVACFVANNIIGVVEN